MTSRLTIIIILIGMITFVYAASKKPHDFNSGECAICHPSVKTDPGKIEPDITGSCQKCHNDLNEIQMHPTDIVPNLAVPADMPLYDGKVTCLTCHFVHPDKKMQFTQKHFFLRRQTRGAQFCSICHSVDEKGHIVLENAHIGKYEELDANVKIDFLSLSCLKCHEDTVNKQELASIGAGLWHHPDKVQMNHPIGIDYEKYRKTKNSKDYFPAKVLKIKLYEGKIGCGTCHSITAKSRKILVMEEEELCTECHNR